MIKVSVLPTLLHLSFERNQIKGTLNSGRWMNKRWRRRLKIRRRRRNISH